MKSLLGCLLWTCCTAIPAFAQSRDTESAASPTTPSAPAEPAAPGPAAETPRIAAIILHGNDVTRDRTILREVSIQVGDPADPTAIERSRQAIQDLGLFRKVSVSETPTADGVAVEFTVKEKWYILGYPRLSANSDGQNSAGVELRWDNLWGLNHSLRLIANSSDQKDEGRGRQLSYMLGYSAPFIFDSPYRLDLSANQNSTPVHAAGGDDFDDYEERIRSFETLLSRKFGDKGASSQGWRLGGGIRYSSEHSVGDNAPADWGDTWALVTTLQYKNQHDHVYDDSGTLFHVRYEFADQHVLSDYTTMRLTGDFVRAWQVGDRAHETVEFAAQAGTARGSRSDRPPFSLGGAQGLRGYDHNAFEGNAFYSTSLTWLRPTPWPWLRTAVALEGGNVYDEVDSLSTQVHCSLGLGVRVRIPRLVGVEFETGFAVPLDGGGYRLFMIRKGI